MIILTDNAKQHIKEIVIEAGQSMLRLFVQGGGCAGLNYGFEFCDDYDEDEDFLMDVKDDVKLVIDGTSFQYVDGATINYENNLMGSQFTFKNPNSKATCGCGSSFAI